MSSESTCHFCGKEPSPSQSLYSCPRCQIRYCSVACYKNSDHASCSESFYRQWIESECLPEADQLFDRARSGDDGEETVFRKKDVKDPKIFSFSADNAADIDDQDVNEQLQKLGITDPNDVEELLEALTDEEKEHFLKLVGDGALEKMDKKERSSKEAASPPNNNPASSVVVPWWGRFSSLVITESVLEDLPPYHSYSDVLHRLDTISMPSRLAPTIKYDILNALTAYCLLLRQSKFQGFWSMDESDSIQEHSNDLLRISSCLSSTKVFESVRDAVEEALFKALPDETARRLAKSDLIIILKNFDWRKSKEPSGRNQFVFLALCDLYSLLGKSMNLSHDSEDKKTIFRVCKKLEFYLKWADLNRDCWRNLAEEIEVIL